MSRFIEASYITPVNPRYRGNPYIECLPECLGSSEILDYFYNIPNVTQTMRELPREIRAEMVDILKDFRVPLQVHEDFTNAVDSMIKDGYVGRNPKSPFREDLKLRRDVYDGINSQNYRNNITCNITSVPSSRTLLGVSGVGKTTAIRGVLSRYPQVIKHSSYQGEALTRTQIVYLYLNTPADITPEAFCGCILSEVDKALGISRYAPEYYRKPHGIDKAVRDTASILLEYGVGLLVVDEIQELITQSTDPEKLLKLFLNIANEWKCPILFIGTIKAEALLQENVRTCRRLISDGITYWELMQEDSLDWQTVLELMWPIQLTRTETRLSNEIRDVLYKESQGNLSILISLYRSVQKKVILSQRDPLERITPAIIKEVAETDFKPFQTFTRALEVGDISLLTSFEDLIPNPYEKTIQQPQVIESPSPLTRIQLDKIKEDKLALALEIKNILIGFGLFEYLTEEDFERIALESVRSVSVETDITELKKQAMSEALKRENELEQKQKEKQQKSQKERHEHNRTSFNQLLNLHKQANQQNKTVYDTLKESDLTGLSLGEDKNENS